MGSNQIGSEKVLFLHGFWGQSADWNFLKTQGFKYAYEAPSYVSDAILGSGNFISDWGSQFIEWKRKNWGSEKLTAVGYSQGGRLLLHALAAHPEEFKKLVLISSHPGLTKFEEKEQRLAHDRQWAQKFRTLDWEKLNSEWDTQGVFKTGSSPKRIESDFNRESLALCFENWSLAHQHDFRDLINQNISKIQIILGEQDTKYVKLYHEFLKDLSVLKMEKGAAHRVPFDQPTKLVEILNSIIES